MKKIRVYACNPNGTNDIEIVDMKSMEVVDTMPEALFGVMFKTEWTLMPIKAGLKSVAVSPVSDGSKVIELLNKHLK